jgi:hypothetical protein
MNVIFSLDCANLKESRRSRAGLRRSAEELNDFPHETNDVTGAFDH